MPLVLLTQMHAYCAAVKWHVRTGAALHAQQTRTSCHASVSALDAKLRTGQDRQSLQADTDCNA